MNITRVRRFKYPLCLAMTPWQFPIDFDTVTSPPPEESGMDRIKRLFRLNQYNEVDAHMSQVLKTTMYGMIFGTLLGSLLITKSVVEKFIDENQGTAFLSKKDARKRLVDNAILNYGKIFRIYGLKIGTFCFMYSFTTTCLSRYRSESYASDNVIGGAVAGCVYKLKAGPKATLVGTAVGAAGGSIVALFTMVATYLAGITLKDIDNYVEARNIKEHREPTPVQLPGDTSEEHKTEKGTKQETKTK